MQDIIFLFGAGASKGAGSILPEAPPLGNPLFYELIKSFPGSWGGLPKEIGSVFNSQELGFEQGMQLIYERYPVSFIPQLMREMAIYFIQFRPIPGASLYCKLIKFLKDHGILNYTTFSTLNYDCILELALFHQGIDIDYIFGKLIFHNNNISSVLKLHGSCNMMLEGINARGEVYYGQSVGFEGGISATLDTNFILNHFLNGTSLAPVMCLFMKGKPLNIAYSNIKHLQESWTEKVLNINTKHIFIIGVRPLIEDQHIWQPLAKTSASLYYIGDQDQWEEWHESNKIKNGIYLGQFFHTAFDYLLEKLNECRKH